MKNCQMKSMNRPLKRCPLALALYAKVLVNAFVFGKVSKTPKIAQDVVALDNANTVAVQD